MVPHLSTANTDFLPQSEVLTCRPGDTRLCVSVTILNDTTLETTESFLLTMEIVTGGVARLTLAPRQAQVCITDDDSELSIHHQKLQILLF